MNIPKNLMYTKEHEWARIDGDVATIGITEFAVSQLGDITLVEMPDAGQHMDAGDSIGTIESVKAVSDMFAPVTGSVIELNAALEDEPEIVNEDCYDAGWMLRVRLSDPGNRDGLLDADAYSAFIETLDH